MVRKGRYSSIMTKLIMTVGLPGSGKSTWALQEMGSDSVKAFRVNRDELRMTLFGKYVLSPAQEAIVTTFQHKIIKEALDSGLDVYVDDTNLNPRFSKKLMEIGNQYGAEVIFKDFTQVSVEECLKNIQKRVAGGGRDVPEAVVRSMYDRYIKGRGGFKAPTIPTYDIKEYVIDPVNAFNYNGKPWAVIVDIDGTVAQMSGRSPYDWKRVGEDTPVENVLSGVHAMAASGYKILFTSGRDGSCREVTEAWLDHNYSRHGWELLMREANDNRPDWIVKAEIFDTKIRDFYNVRCVFDDRDQVVHMWRKMGLTVYQVAEGNF